MPVSRERLRQAVGDNLNALSEVRGVIISDSRISYNGPDLRGQTQAWIWYNGQSTYIATGPNAVDVQSGRLELAHPLQDSISGNEVEVWEPTWSPVRINNFINQAILDARFSIYSSAGHLYLCVTPRNRVLELAQGLSRVVNVYYRRPTFYYGQLYTYHPYRPDQVAAGFVVERDNADFRFSGSQRITIPPGLVDPTATTTFSRINLAGVTHLEGWYKTTGVTELELALLSGENIRMDYQALPLTNGEWEYLQLEIPDPSVLSDIDRARVRFTGSGKVWLDGMWSVDQSSINWEAIHRTRWRIERETRRLVLEPLDEPNWGGMVNLGSVGRYGAFSSGYRMPPESVMRITVARDPATLEGDSDETDVPFEYIVARATELAYSAVSGGRDTDRENFRQQVGYWREQRMIQQRNFPPISGGRRVDD